MISIVTLLKCEQVDWNIPFPWKAESGWGVQALSISLKFKDIFLIAGILSVTNVHLIESICSIQQQCELSHIITSF